jgi:hypothetical protein
MGKFYTDGASGPGATLIIEGKFSRIFAPFMVNRVPIKEFS